MKKTLKLLICAGLLSAALTTTGNAQSREPYRLALRTNLLYDGLLYPTLGLEWRANYCFGIKVDGSWSDWDYGGGYQQKMWMVSPEFRWYMGYGHKFYLGLGGNIGRGDVNDGPMGKIMQKLYTDGRAYDGNFYGGGLVIGYQANLSRSFALDFNLGGGLTHFEYDTYDVVNGQRQYVGRDQTKNLWGLTQAGITLVWKIVK